MPDATEAFLDVSVAALRDLRVKPAAHAISRSTEYELIESVENARTFLVNLALVGEELRGAREIVPHVELHRLLFHKEHRIDAITQFWWQ